MKKEGQFEGHNLHRQSVGKHVLRSTHAEMNVLQQFLKQNRVYNLNHVIYKSRGKKRLKKLHNATIYVSRYSTRLTNDEFGHALNMAKPCPHCERMLIRHGIGTVKYTQYVDGENVMVTLKLSRRCRR